MSTQSQPLVSVVTPVYNEAEHLAECIESVLSQTYSNWDYTIVDNCSTDGSLEIARRYAAKDPRIRIHQNEQFLRAIPNHNATLRHISPQSKYCKVVLGDDWILPECLQQMVLLAEEQPSVGIVGAYSIEGNGVNWVGLPYPSRSVPGHELCRRHFIEHLYVFGTATSVLYRADLVRGRNPFYNEANIHADTEVCFALLKTSDFGFVHQVLTFTRVRAGSITESCADIQTDLPGLLHLLLTYGPDYLNPRELEICLDSHLSAYYKMLGKSLMLGRDKKFWEYHKRMLAEARVGFSRVRLAQGALSTLSDAVLNPKDTVGKLRKRMSRTKPSQPQFAKRLLNAKETR